MTEFEKTQWFEKEFSKNFKNEANIYLPYRNRFFEITISIYKHFISQNNLAKVLDLGCGDGQFIQELLKSFTPSEVLLIDGSNEMMDAAQSRLKNYHNVNFTKAYFQDLLFNDLLTGTFDFIFSSLAIHHLHSVEKKYFYEYIYKHLSHGGYFINYDVVLPPSDDLEKLYLSFWNKWINEYPEEERREKLLHIPGQYKENTDNILDTLESQLENLKAIGFKQVDCYFKYGIFSLFGGCK
jgi:tRNA (cmo5U34)-methyltransferase